MEAQKIELVIENSRVISTGWFPESSVLCVIFCHGFPGTNRLSKLFPLLLLHNISFVEVSYRGDKGSEGYFDFLESAKDIRAVVQWIDKQFPNIKKRGLGYSAGGFYTLNLLREHPNTFDDLTLLNPVVDAGIFLKQEVMSDLWCHAKNILRLKESSFYETQIGLLNKKHNPVEFVSELKAPITILQSTEDELLSPPVAKMFFDKLEAKRAYLPLIGKFHDLCGDEKELIETLIGT